MRKQGHTHINACLPPIQSHLMSMVLLGNLVIIEGYALSVHWLAALTLTSEGANATGTWDQASQGHWVPGNLSIS